MVPTAIEPEPKIEQLVIVLFVEPPENLMVEVPEVATFERFDIVSELPPVLSPSIVTLSPPLMSKSAPPATVPLIVLAPLGLIVIEVQLIELFKAVTPVSVVTSAVIKTVTVPVCTVPPFNAVNAPPAIVKDE